MNFVIPWGRDLPGILGGQTRLKEWAHHPLALLWSPYFFIFFETPHVIAAGANFRIFSIHFAQPRPVLFTKLPVADPEILKRGWTEDNVSALSSLLTNAHNELYAFCTGKGKLTETKKI